MKLLNVVQLPVGEIGTNCYLIYRENNVLNETNVSNETIAICIDPGDEVEYILSTLLEKNVQLGAILLTHGHFDHCSAASTLRQKTKAKIYAHKDEECVLIDPKINLSGRFGMPFTVKADIFLQDLEEISIGDISIQTIHTPGHTCGGCSYYVEADGIIFSGDTLFFDSVGRTDFPSGDAVMLVRSIKEKLFTLPDQTKVYPGHGESTTIQREKEYNMYLK